MGIESAPTDGALDAELAALRARAYGVDADIAGDADALARLSELEERHAHESVHRDLGSGTADTGDEATAEPEAERAAAPAEAAAATGEAVAEASVVPMQEGVLRRMTATRGGAMAVGALLAGTVAVAIGAVVAGTSPRPDVVLDPTSAEPSDQVLRLVDYARSLLIDESTLTAFERYRGLEVWAADSALGNRCLLVVEPSSDNLLGAGCVPSPATPAVEIYDVPVYEGDDWHAGLPSGTVVRFAARGDEAVDVWVLEPVVP